MVGIIDNPDFFISIIENIENCHMNGVVYYMIVHLNKEALVV